MRENILFIVVEVDVVPITSHPMAVRWVHQSLVRSVIIIDFVSIVTVIVIILMILITNELSMENNKLVTHTLPVAVAISSLHFKLICNYNFEEENLKKMNS